MKRESIKQSSNTIKTIKIATFRLKDSDTIYSIDVDSIREFITTERLKFSHTLDIPYVKGITTVRNETICVISLSELFGGNSNEAESYKTMIVIEQDELIVGFLVDNIINVHTVPIENIKHIDNFSDNVEYVCNIEINNKNVICVILDVNQLISKIKKL